MNIFIDPAFDAYYQREPIVLVDIGASGGLQDNWKKAERHLKVIGFEPDARSFDDLKSEESSKAIYINKALHKDKGEIDFYLTKKEEASSFFRPNENLLRHFPEPERFKVVDLSRLDADNLDNQLEAHHIQDIDFIKLDTNGSELFVLEGAERALSRVSGIEIEVEFNEVYEGQPLFSDVDEIVRRSGFQLFDLKPRYWKRTIGKRYGGLKGQLIFADALYLLGPEALGKRLALIGDAGLLKSKVLRFISIAFLYGYIDYGIAIFEENKPIFNDEEVQLFYKAIKRQVHIYTRIPAFRGKARIARLFKVLYNMLRHNYDNWSVAQESLGNIE